MDKSHQDWVKLAVSLSLTQPAQILEIQPEDSGGQMTPAPPPYVGVFYLVAVKLLGQHLPKELAPFPPFQIPTYYK
jgi:hypothetical protein